MVCVAWARARVINKIKKQKELIFAGLFSFGLFSECSQKKLIFAGLFFSSFGLFHSVVAECSQKKLIFAGLFFSFGLFHSVVAEATSNTRQMCAIPRSLARGHDKSCDPRHGTKISLILKGANDPRIRD